jgi:uncharacterized protein YecE (DUF72 family)
MPEFRIGISGWRYAPWRKVFYPEDLTQKRELEYASRQLNSIEINGSFYSLQTPKSYRQWFDATPEDFVFSLKGGRYITHMRRLRDIEEPLANFFASGVLALEHKLGPILWQFPPNFSLDLERFEHFFNLLPRTTQQAAELAKGHGKWLKKSRVHAKTDEDRPLRHAIEFRHPSFLVPEFVKLCKKHKVALVFADSAGHFPYTEDITADFLYLRLHGDKELYASGYTNSALEWWAKRLLLWTSGKEPPDAKRLLPPARKRKRDAYIYFDNDIKVHAPFDAKKLAGMLRES